MPRIPDREPEDPGPRAPFEQRERYLRDLELWATEGGRLNDEPGDHMARRLRAMDRDHKRFLDLHSPVKAAVWLALLRPVGELADRAADPSVSGIVALGEAIARKALAGDVAAFNSISDRIEGRVGVRQGDVDPAAADRAQDIAGMIEGVVEALTDAKMEGRFELEGSATDITPTVSPHANGHDADPRVEREDGSTDRIDR